MKDNLYDLSDCLFQLRRWLVAEASPDGGVTFDAAQVDRLERLLLVFGQTALAHAHEISRHRWNAAARADRDHDDVLEEILRPGTNVALFPAVSRPFSDGQPGVST